ncbi:MAG TPA: hypothetical protein PLV72_03800 [Candidatus Magasanikbacteria bacterium]|nr:hypothetical protein [Candidatus Magasanikbacteria bacterium]
MPVNNNSAHVVAVDMGYGHLRAAYPLRDIAVGGKIINANSYAGIPKRDYREWNGTRRLYEFVSSHKDSPIFGQAAFAVMEKIQKIDDFYPARDLSHPSYQVRVIYSQIRKGWGRDLVLKLNRDPHPLITTFFAPAYFAEEHGFKEDIFMVCCDADVARAWAPMNPKKSRIQYLVPNRRVKERLLLYGVREEKIFVTGFPLPKENIGGKKLTVLRESLAKRLSVLDPHHRFRHKYRHTLEEVLGDEFRHVDEPASRPLTITFAVGGAGAQREIGRTIVHSLHSEIKKGTVKINLVAGVRNDVYRYYSEFCRECRLTPERDVSILYAESKEEYFKKFNLLLNNTDILWTKPSELSFYVGLGLPIIIAPPVGSQEHFNKQWLHAISAGVDEEDPHFTNEWLFDWLESGWLAEAAMKGFLDAPRNGAYHIEEVVLHGRRSEIEMTHLL